MLSKTVSPEANSQQCWVPSYTNSACRVDGVDLVGNYTCTKTSGYSQVRNMRFLERLAHNLRRLKTFLLSKKRILAAQGHRLADRRLRSPHFIKLIYFERSTSTVGKQVCYMYSDLSC